MMRAIAILVFMAASVPAGRAQTGPVFDVASVKPNPAPPNFSQTHQITPGHIHFVHVGLYQLLLDAFQIQNYQLIAPDHLPDGSWDIEATMPVDSTPAQLASMTRALLEKRFGLQAHIEKRSLPVYSLTIATPNKLTATTDPSGQLASWGTASAIQLRGRGELSGLAGMLSRQVGRPVFDGTGLSGRYQIDIEYSPVDVQNGAGRDDLSAPSLFTVLKDKLGLKLEPGNREFDCVIVDHVNASATPNQ